MKTSVLLMDKTLGAKTDKILFVKIANDGFGLGAQRKELKTSDLPDALNLIRDFQAAILQGDTSRFENVEEMPASAVAVEKTTIAANGNYNLSADRYRTDKIQQHKFDFVQLNEVCEINPQKSELKNLSPETMVSFVPMADLNENQISFTAKNTKQLSEVINGYTYFKDNDVLLAKVTPCFENGKAGIAKNLENGIGFGSSEYYIFRCNGKVLPELIYFSVTSDRFREIGKAQMTGTGGLQRVPKDFVQNYKIPLPPLSIQKETVEKIESFQRIIDGAKQVVAGYKPQIDIQPDWEMVELGEVCTLQRGYDLPKQNWIEGIYPIVGSNGIIGYHKEFKAKAPGVVTGRSGTIGKVHFIDKDYFPHNTSLYVKDFKGNEPKFVKYLLESIDLKSLGAQTAAVPSLDRKNAHLVKVQLPPPEEQKQIVAQIEREQSLVNANRELINIFEQKVKDEINKLWEQ